MPEQYRQNARSEMSDFVKIWNRFVKIKIDAEKEGYEQKGQIDELDGKGKFDFEDFGNNLGQKRQNNAGKSSANLVVFGVREAIKD